MEEPQIETIDWKNIIWSMIKEKKLSEEHIYFLKDTYSIKMKDMTTFIVLKLCEKECEIGDNGNTILWALKFIKKAEKMIADENKEDRKLYKRIKKFESMCHLIGPLNDEMRKLLDDSRSYGHVCVPHAMLTENIDGVFLEHIETMEEAFDVSYQSGHCSTSGHFPCSVEDCKLRQISTDLSSCWVCGDEFYQLEGNDSGCAFCVVCLRDYMNSNLAGQIKLARKDFHTNMQDFMNVMHLSDDLLAASKDKDPKAPF
jgi:hypothetical protein